ncbi:hypothetical protein LTR12_013963 [Friedmanniomyces endolithicus]|nr:hypothetical protein LTR12_013963 [Friedmanniomyces endolithicus]
MEQFWGLKIKEPHTIIKKWPMKLKARPSDPEAQKEFDLLQASMHSGIYDECICGVDCAVDEVSTLFIVSFSSRAETANGAGEVKSKYDRSDAAILTPCIGLHAINRRYRSLLAHSFVRDQIFEGAVSAKGVAKNERCCSAGHL